MSAPRSLVLFVKERPVFFLQGNILSVVARVEWQFEYTFWSFLGCSRISRFPCVNIHAWTDKGLHMASIRTDTEEEASDLVEHVIAQIPIELNEDLDEEEVFVEGVETQTETECPCPPSQQDCDDNSCQCNKPVKETEKDTASPNDENQECKENVAENEEDTNQAEEDDADDEEEDSQQGEEGDDEDEKEEKQEQN